MITGGLGWPDVLYQGYHHSDLHSIYCSEIGSFYQQIRETSGRATAHFIACTNIWWAGGGHGEAGDRCGRGRGGSCSGDSGML